MITLIQCHSFSVTFPTCFFRVTSDAPAGEKKKEAGTPGKRRGRPAKAAEDMDMRDEKEIDSDGGERVEYITRFEKSPPCATSIFFHFWFGL